MKTKTPEQKLRSARTRLIMEKPFFGFPSMQLSLRESKGLGTLATDGQSLFYDPDFIATNNPEELRFLVAHEALHNMLLHPFRLTDKFDRDLANVAMDYAVNLILQKNGFTLRPDALCDMDFTDLAWETIYNRLKSQAKPKDCPQDVLPPGQGKPGDESQSASVDPVQLESQWKSVVIQASEIAKGQGNCPQGLDQIVTVSQAPKLNWKDVLRDFSVNLRPGSYSWFPPNRRHLWRGMILPQVQKEPHCNLGVVLDSSGSTAEYWADFLGEVNAMLASMDIKITLLTCHTTPNHVGDFANEELPPIESDWGGGTDFREPFKWFPDNRPDVDGIVYLTDGYGDFPDTLPVRTLWVMVSDVIPPLGDFVRIPCA